MDVRVVKMNKIILFLILFLSIFSLNIKAQEENNRNYTKYVIENYWDDLAIVGYVAGVGEGLRTSSAIIGRRHKIEEFCPPLDLALSSEDYFSIIKQQYLRQNKENLPTVLTLYFGLENTFPCN